MPTMKEIAEALREAGALYLLMWQEAEKYEDKKTALLWEERYEDAEQLASQVEQMRCETCEHYISDEDEEACKIMILEFQGPYFYCKYWKEKEMRHEMVP